MSATGFSTKNVTATETDNDTLNFETNPDTDISVPEGGSAALQVRLTAQPLVDINVTVARISGDDDITVSAGSSLTFTPANWNTYQNATIAAAEDDDAADSTAAIRVSDNAANITSKDVTATELDNDELEFQTNPDTDISVPEGGSAALQVRLTAQPLVDINVTVARISGDDDITVSAGSSLTFTPANWNTYQNATIAAAEDDDAADSTAAIRVSDNAANITSKDVTATELDNDELEFQTDLSSVNVSEGTTAIFQVRLTAQPLSSVNVTVARLSGDTDITVQSGGSLTFTTTNWGTYQNVTLAAAEDADAIDGTATIRVSDNAANITSNDVTANEQDNDELRFGTNTDSIDIAEGNTATLQVRLTAQPAGDVNVTVSRASGDEDITVQSGSSLTFTTVNWDTYQDVNLAAAEDADAGDGSATIRISDNAAVIASKDVTANEQDNDELEFEVNPTAAINVPEGNTAILHVRLTAQPLADVNVTVSRTAGDVDITVTTGASLTFTTANWNTFQNATIAAAEDTDADNGIATIQVSDDAANITAKNITATETDNDELNFETNPASDMTVDEGSTAALQIRLTAQPLSEVNVTISRISGDSDITIQSGSALTFTTANWNTFQSATIAAAQDVDTENGSANIRISDNDASITSKNITVNEQDDDDLNFETDVNTLIVPEGDAATFQVRLSHQPSGDVNVTVSRVSGDGDISVQAGAALKFTSSNWNTFQAVALAAAQDVDIVDGAATIRVNASGITAKDITANEQDDDELNFETSTSAVTVPEGSSATFQVRLSHQPSGDVNVTVSRISGDSDITVQSGASLTFNSSNWNTYQIVTLAASQDSDTSNGTASMQIRALGIPNITVTAQEQDDDALNIVTNTNDVTVPEGATATFQVRLSAQPESTTNVTVARVSGDTDLTIQSGASLVFTTSNWNSYQTVTLSAAQDDDTNNSSATIRISASGITSKDITATEQEDDTLNIETNIDAVTVPEGGSASFSVRLSALPDSTVNISVTHSGGDDDISITAGGSLIFSPSNWSIFQSVTLAAAEDTDNSNGSATIRITAADIPTKFITATESDDDATNGEISLTLNPDQGTNGSLIEIFVNLANNNSSLNYFGLDFHFDSTVFTYKHAVSGSLSTDWTITATPDPSDPGKIVISGSAGTTIPLSSNGDVLKITLQVKCLDLGEIISQIRIDNYSYDFADEFSPEPCTTDFTFIPCSRLGDVNGDTMVTPGDAQMAFEIFLGKRSPEYCQESTSDADCNGFTTPGDAQNIFEHFLGKRTLPECCEASAATSGPPSFEKVVGRPSRPKTRFPRRLYPLNSLGKPDDLVAIPIVISNPRGIQAFGFDLNYPSYLLEFIRVEKSPLTRDFDYVHSIKKSAGWIQVEGKGQISPQNVRLGALAVVFFKVKSGGHARGTLAVTNPFYDLYEADLDEGFFLRSYSLGEEFKYLSFRNPEIRPDGTIRIPVEVSNTFKIKALGMEIAYSQADMTFRGIEHTVLTENFITLLGYEFEPGKVRLGGYNLCEIQTNGPGILFQLVFSTQGTNQNIEIIQLLDDLKDFIIQ